MIVVFLVRLHQTGKDSKMNIFLCLSQTPDTTAKIKFSEDRKALVTQDMQFVINPYDDHAIASAMELKEKHNGTLTVIHVGNANAEQTIRKALAIGADEAIRVDTEPKDGFNVAKQLAAVLQDKDYNIIFTGRESIDYNGSMVCDLLGEMLDIPSVAFVKNYEINGGSEITMSRFIDGGSESVKSQIPLVISSTKELAEPRIPNMRGIMQARSKKLDVVDAVEAPVHTEYVEYEPPQEKGECQFIDPEEAEKLIDILADQEKVI